MAHHSSNSQLTHPQKAPYPDWGSRPKVPTGPVSGSAVRTVRSLDLFMAMALPEQRGSGKGGWLC